MVGVLLWLLIFVLIVVVVYWVLNLIPATILPPSARSIIMAIIALIFLAILLSALFGLMPLPQPHWRNP